MRKVRVYQQEHLYAGQVLIATPATSHHLLKVLRLKVGHPVEVFNGHLAFHSVIVATHKCVHLELRQSVQYQSAYGLSIHLALACIKPDPFDTFLQKATELGVQQITPLCTELTHMQVSAKKMRVRYPHWSKTIIHACEQSGRYDIPHLHPLAYFSAFTEAYVHRPVLKLICHPYRQHPQNVADLLSALHDQSEVVVLIGPEGGFSAREVAIAMDASFLPIQIAANILRADTAALAIMSLLGYYQHRFVPA